LKTRAASFLSLLLLSLVLILVPASAQVIYDNGPVNGTVDAWTINFGYVVSDTLVCCKVDSPGGDVMTGFDFWAWESPGDTALTVDWSVTSAEFGGTTLGSGTAKLTDTFISVNPYGFDIDKLTASGLNVALSAGTYWLNLQNATTAQGNPLYWDENSGVGCNSPGCPSSASESAVGTIPSEAFDIIGSNSGTIPEPASIMLFGSGVLALLGVLRRRLF
jgi:hypothetical protein